MKFISWLNLELTYPCLPMIDVVITVLTFHLQQPKLP